MGQVPATGPFNLNQFEFVGQVAGINFWLKRLDFLTKMGSLHEGTTTGNKSAYICIDLLDASPL